MERTTADALRVLLSTTPTLVLLALLVAAALKGALLFLIACVALLAHLIRCTRPAGVSAPEACLLWCEIIAFVYYVGNN